MMDNLEMERPQPGRSHDSSKRLNLRYQYEHDMRPESSVELRSRYHHVRKNVPSEQSDLQGKLERVTEERDKLQKQLEQSKFIFTQHSQLQVYAQKMKYENDQQLHRMKVEHDQKMSRVMEELSRTRSDLECAIQDRDDYKYKVTELQRETQRLTEKLQSVGPRGSSSHHELVEERDRLAGSVAELKAEKQKLKDQLKMSSSMSSLEGQEVKKLREKNSQLTKQLEETQDRLRRMEEENKTLQNFREGSPGKKSSSRSSLGSSEESIEMVKRGQSEEGTQFLRSTSYSVTEMERHGGMFNQERGLFSKKKFSSASNLLEEGNDSILPQLQSQLNRAFRDKEKLSQQLSEMREARNDLQTRIKVVETENEALREELNKMKADRTAVQEQVKLVEGVTMQQTTETYEKNMQLQSQILELQTERTLAERQRDIALREKDRVLTDAIQTKKKLEAIKAQRQKDAKELSSMKKTKDKTVLENQESAKKIQELEESVKELEKRSASVLKDLKQITGSNEIEVEKLLSVVEQQQTNYVAMLKCLYGRENVSDISSSSALAKLEALYREKSNLVVEVEDLQRSASKQNEEYIFDLKQTIETLYMEQDTLQGKNRSLISRIGKLEIERDKLRKECERLDKQCQELNATLTFPSATESKADAHSTNWDDNWDMKSVQIPLGSEGKAGFSVVGGKDQPQLPNPGAFIVTAVTKGGPADGILRVGDVLENINGCNLSNADHSKAVAAVKDSKGLLDIMLRRRNKAHALQVGVAGAILRLGEREKRKESHEFALMLQKDGLGFNYDWETQYTITGINENGPADKILQNGDRIVKVNGTVVGKEKPNSVKKLLKPHKGVLRLVVEREEEIVVRTKSHSGPSPHPISEMVTPKVTASSGSSEHGSAKNVFKVGGSSWGSDDYPNTQNSEDYRHRSDSYHSATQESSASQEPVKIEGATASLRYNGRYYADHSRRPNSDGVMYGGSHQRRVEFEELSSEIGSTGYSESISESFLSESSTCPDGYLPMDSSQTSIELTFHSTSQVSHNRLTVQSTISTQPEKDHGSDDDETYFARDDGTRTTFRTRSGSDGMVGSQFSEYEVAQKSKSLKKSSKSSGDSRKLLRLNRGRKSGSLSQLSEPEYDQYVESSSSRKKSKSGSVLSLRGRSRSNLSLTPARSMTSVQEEPRRSTSTTSVNERDPLADATYIRANFSYIPLFPQELTIKPGDVFHIIEDAPIRHGRSFWVSRLNEDGTDAGVGAIPNTARAQEWLNAQGNTLDIALYEEVEAFTGVRPVLICGVLANQITNLLVESYPKLFHYYHPEFVEGTARINEARLNREQSEGRIIHFERHGDTGFAVIRKEALTHRDFKGRHVLIAGSIASLRALKTFAPPISVLVKAGAEDSINTFGPDKLSTAEVQKMYADAKILEEEHAHQFTACLMLVFEDTLLRQIVDIVKHEKLNQTWVPVVRDAVSP